MNDRASILAVGGTSESLALLVKILTPAGYDVRPADSGELALAAVAASRPELIVLCMQGLDGLDVWRRLKAREEMRRIPIILIGAFANKTEWVQGLQLGAADYVTKPFQPEELLTRVRTHLALHRAAVSLEQQTAALRRANEQLQSEIVERRRVEDDLRQSLDRAARSRRVILGALEDQKRVEEALRQSEERTRILFEHAADSILLLEITPEGIPVIRDANNVTFRTLGYERDELIGQPVSFMEVEPAASSVVAERRRNVLSGLGPTFEARHRCKDGTILDFECSVTEMQIGSKTLGISVERDVTERRRAQAERRRAQAEREKLEEQLRVSQKMDAIGSLAGGVAHDFNNLLCVILSYTGFALEGVSEDDPLRDDLLEVKKASESAAALTRQLLAFSSKQVLQPVPLDLNQIAAGLEKMLRRILGEDIDFVQVLAPDLGLTLADPGQIEQVLMNLVVNARDAMPEGGKLTIETANIEIDEEYVARHVNVKPGPYVQLVVTDTGCGMDQQTRARLFEPFFTTKEKGKGTGLGLSTVYGIVKQSDGNIWVYSELGQGTTFKIYLPRDLVATTATAIKPPTVPRWSTGTDTILVVEDEAALRKVARRTLDAAGYTVLSAADGDEALLISAQHAGDVHLLLTDVVMPRMSGRVLAQELAKTRPALKVLYMSGYTDDAIVHHGVLDTGTHFLGKPFTAADLMRKVREVLDEDTPRIADGREQAVNADAEDPAQAQGSVSCHAAPRTAGTSPAVR